MSPTEGGSPVPEAPEELTAAARAALLASITVVLTPARRRVAA
jgi:hypothetical protein